MLSVIKLLPVVLRIYRRAKVIAATAKNSTTCEYQKMVALPVAVLVASLGYFIPELSESAVAFGLVAAIVGILAPYVSRFVGYKEDSLNRGILLMAVKNEEDKAWRAFDGYIGNAKNEKWRYGVDQDGNVYDLLTGEQTGQIRLRGNSQEESNALMREFVAHLKGNKDVDDK